MTISGKARLGLAEDGLAVGADHLLQARHLAALGQGEADQARNDEQVDGEELEEGGEDAAAAGDLLVGAPRARCTMYWSVHQYQRPMIGAQMAMPSQGKLVVEIPGLLDDLAGGVVSSTGAQVPSTPAGISGFQRLNMSEPQMRRSSPQPPSLCRP